MLACTFRSVIRQHQDPAAAAQVRHMLQLVTITLKEQRVGPLVVAKYF